MRTTVSITTHGDALKSLTTNPLPSRTGLPPIFWHALSLAPQTKGGLHTNTPWAHDGWAVATDSKILVRAPLHLANPRKQKQLLVNSDPIFPRPDIEKFFALADKRGKEYEQHTIPENLLPSIPCPICHGHAEYPALVGSRIGVLPCNSRHPFPNPNPVSFKGADGIVAHYQAHYLAMMAESGATVLLIPASPTDPNPFGQDVAEQAALVMAPSFQALLMPVIPSL
jgi:hypothetical protein